MITNAAILMAVVAVGLLLWAPKVHGSANWRAMTTPLASIIGSGFLVLGPILENSYGKFAPLVMAALCLGAYMFGTAIRHNIHTINDIHYARSALELRLENWASAILGFAYMISVAYYLNLFGAFGVSLTSANDPVNAKLLTTAIFVVILSVGWTRGFKTLESMEYVSVTTKLAIIAGLFAGLGLYFWDKATSGALVFNAPTISSWPALTLAFGLVVTVQGFETSRYLGDSYDAATRIKSMRWSQFVSSAIYVVYILMLAFVFQRGEMRLNETAIVDMMKIVAPILPVLLVVAALAAQFSAAVADTSGSGGLVNELSKNRLSARQAYALLTLVGLALTWSADVFQIISYASRAFAAYYALQSTIAAVSAYRKSGNIGQCAFFAALAMLGGIIVVFGQPVEG